jgi:YfiH family protein
VRGRGTSWSFTDRTNGHGGTNVVAADDPYASFNLADHVGDQPALVAANRAALAERVRRGGPPVAFMQQVHGASVAVIEAHPGPSAPPVDALVTTSADLPLAVLVADCVPLLLRSTEGDVVAAVHAGRLGIQRGVVAATLATIADLGCSPNALVARLGPSIGPCCYEVPAAMQDDVCAVVPQARATTRWGTPALDIRSAVAAQLRDAGVGEVSVDGRCTYEEPTLYSYRRDGVTGRFAGVVTIARR